MHEVADAVEAGGGVSLIHIADPTGAAIRAAGLRRVGLLGTAFTMERRFYRDRLAERHGLDVIVPDADDRAAVHRIIYDELVHGNLRPASRDVLRAVIARLAASGAGGVILGCTEIGLLVGPADADVPLFDTTVLHAGAGVDWLLAG
jgi:aspartate racemase